MKTCSRQEQEAISFEELKKRDRDIVNRIIDDDSFAYVFFHDKCRPLLSRIAWTIYGNDCNYEDLVNELFLYLKKPDKDGNYWHNLKTFDYRTSLFDWIKIVATRQFLAPINERFVIPDRYVDSGVAENVFSELESSDCRKYMHFKFILKYDDALIADKLHLPIKQLPALKRKSIRALKKVLIHTYPEYLESFFLKNKYVVVNIDDENAWDKQSIDIPIERIDAFQYLSAMPDGLYRQVLFALFIEDKDPEELAVLMHRKVSNIYLLKSRGLDQLRDIIIFSNEIQGIEQYINLVSDDRKRLILRSIFIDKMNYEDVCTLLNITENQFRKLKKEALKEIKKHVFKPQS